MEDTSYGSFAEVYDELMDNVPYREWADFLVSVFQEYGIFPPAENLEAGDCEKEANRLNNGSYENAGELQKNLAAEKGTVLDLGCGTGTLTLLLSKAGYDMIGVDNSEEMLAIAREKSEGEILYLLQDMREFELYGTVGAVCSVCDSLNYILKEEELVQVFSLVNNYLYPGGVFVFDFNTVYKYRTVIGDATIAENREDCSFIWENYYHEEEEINEYDLTVFVRREQEKGGEALFRRFSETHFQRGYTLEQMKAALAAAGLEFVKALDGDSHKEVTPESERIYVVARECEGKEKHE